MKFAFNMENIIMEDIYNYVKDIILSIGGKKEDVKRVIKIIKENGYTTMEEIELFLENLYI